jgi:hypothetical protein
LDKFEDQNGKCSILNGIKRINFELYDRHAKRIRILESSKSTESSSHAVPNSREESSEDDVSIYLA